MAYEQVIKREMEWKVPFKRDNAFPLDRSSIFTSKEEAENYIRATVTNPHSKGVPYIGQTIAVSYINEETSEEYLDIYKVTKTGERATMSPIIDLGDSLYYDNNNKLGIKIVDTNTSYNALTTDNTGALTVPMMDVKATKITEDIVIKDGPLASIAEQAYPEGKVPANTSIEEFLKSLLCVEIWPNATANTSDYSLSLSDVSVTHNNSTDLVAYGSEITFNEITAKKVSITKTDPSVKPFTYGYSDSEKGDKISSTAITKNWNISAVTGDVYTLSASTENFTGQTPSIVTGVTHDKCKLPACTLTVGLGENKYIITEKAPKHIGSHDAINSKYIISNLGNRSDKKMSESINAKTDIEKPCNNRQTTKTITGVYPIFTNCVNSTTRNIEEAKNSIIKNTNTFIVEYGPEIAVETMDMFAYPASHTLVKVEKWNALSNGGEFQEETINETQITDISKTLGKTNVSYKLWKRLGQPYNDSVKIRFTLNNKTSEKVE